MAAPVPAISESIFVVALTAANLLTYHWPLYRFSVERVDMGSGGGLLILLTVTVALAFINITLMGALAVISIRLLKLFAMIFCVFNSVALYFMVSYGVVLDRSMMGNVFNTRMEEVTDLFHPTLLFYFSLLGILPAMLISRIRVQGGEKMRLLGLMAGALVFTLVWGFSASTTWLWIDKFARPLGGQALPWSYLMNSARHLKRENQTDPVYALLPRAKLLDERRHVVVLVIGETARAANFSLYGYERKTNPRLAQQHVRVLKNARSCSTYTTASLKCILSAIPEALAGNGGEPLPNFLMRHGVEVIWRTRNWGEPPIQTSRYETGKDFGCSETACQHDEALLVGLADMINSSDSQRILIVLHQKGSHGPAYSTRYPERFEKFNPVCRSVDLKQCDHSALINAYDNTIVYTDHVLAETIELLQLIPDRIATMLYVSDHGESLGEYGVYLHGLPNAIAPEVQRQIPMFLWTSNWTEGDRPEIVECSEGLSCDQFSVFHTVLEALGLGGGPFIKDKSLLGSPEQMF